MGGGAPSFASITIGHRASAQVVYATGNTDVAGCPCGSGNPHAAGSDNPNPPTNPQGKFIGGAGFSNNVDLSRFGL